jgi:putative glutamine amidotransferase
VDEARDEIEIALAQYVVKSGQPFLGICRGAQVVNVALGGSLYTDIPDQFGRSLRHDWFPKIRRDHLAHTVAVDPGSRLAEILGTRNVEVNSIHHQAVQQAAPGLIVTGHAPDGLVESLELEGHLFGILVQWHPEWLPGQEPMQRLFHAFVAAAGLTGRRDGHDE